MLGVRESQWRERLQAAGRADADGRHGNWRHGTEWALASADEYRNRRPEHVRGSKG
jgi:hypothetical protein